jgi:hypothetical protein
MKDSAELNMVYHKMYDWLMDFHGYYMDAPEMIPAGAMSGLVWPTKRFILREGS